MTRFSILLDAGASILPVNSFSNHGGWRGSRLSELKVYESPNLETLSPVCYRLFSPSENMIARIILA